MFGVEDHFVNVLFKIRDRVVQNLEVGLIAKSASASRTCRSQVLPTTVATGVSARSINCRLRSADARDIGAPGRAEGRDFRVAQLSFLTS